jgi:Ca-activated chloride channel family protein
VALWETEERRAERVAKRSTVGRDILIGMHLPWLIVVLLSGSAAAQQSQISPALSVGIVYDSSGSMRSKIDKSRQAVAQFFKTISPQDEFFLIQSSNRPVLVSGFTASTDEILKRLTSMQSEGGSALLDAIYMALHQVKKARNPRKALLVISDGANNCSRYREREIKSLTREADVPVYAIGIYESFALRGRTTEELFGPGLLHGIAERSGAHHFAVETWAELPDVIAKLSTDMRTAQQ